MNFKDMEVDSIEYDIKADQKPAEKPAAIAQRDLENAMDTEQIQTFTCNKDNSEEHSFEHSRGFVWSPHFSTENQGPSLDDLDRWIGGQNQLEKWMKVGSKEHYHDQMGYYPSS